MDRRSFVSRMGLMLLASLGIESLLSSCGSTSTPTAATATTTGGNCSSNGTSISIQVQHTPNHTLTIPAADVVAGVTKTYTLADNGSGHTHQVTISAADFVNLQKNQGIQETSTVTGHTHIVTVNCS